MPPVDLLAFVRGALPPPPARILEIGAGGGELAAELRGAGYAVHAVDPAAESGSGVERATLLEVAGTFDAALAVVSLHHVEPLDESCAHLATLMRPAALLVIDEFDVTRLDERAAEWWLGQRRALGVVEEHDAAGLIAFMRGHVHPLPAVLEALQPFFALAEPVRGAYLHRWSLETGLRDVEERLIAKGTLPATGARLVTARRSSTADLGEERRSTQPRA
ncbi:MAG TPA: methyltransferase domain-containing protein [Solirubrobacteraceae bacterium]|nr:methyltransferase domain-containing protein [Solirubrobacteraceae bacterium]